MNNSFTHSHLLIYLSQINLVDGQTYFISRKVCKEILYSDSNTPITVERSFEEVLIAGAMFPDLSSAYDIASHCLLL